MRIGLITHLHGRPDGDTPAPTWQSVASKAKAAEAVGFDMLVYEDALLYPSDSGYGGVWESMAISGGVAVATDHISFGPSVINSPYRSPAFMAKIAETLDEMSAGRFVLGIGAGNTADTDYQAYGFPTDRRYSRFAEAIEIIHTLLKTGRVNHAGDFYSATGTELVLRGPSGTGPKINIAAAGPKMLRLVARYGDQWNWWAWGETIDETRDRLTPIIDDLDTACRGTGRDPGTLGRTLDIYTVIPPGTGSRVDGMDHPVQGTVDEQVAYFAALGDLGFTEIRVDLADGGVEAIEAMAPVVAAVHRL